ncbi:N-acetyltransferase [Paenibacillus sp. CFBP 13594]|uniref:N-acetyltransferase n=1 Tax=Paenibacillus sp. CFBP 13594 TaxID=2774037 RepID=UPI00177E54A2|nr:N-acetyltransferase [Paenibacillus sp. CFBP 13594]MBD8839506.1 N-acetyltransferase [Paenibacillus sp. CFBP 13594]
MRTDIFDLVEQFSLVNLSEGYRLEDFYSSIPEYVDFLCNEALLHQELNLSRTYLLINKRNADIVAYMSLISDSIKLKQDERDSYFQGEISFPSYPAMKIAKLAVDERHATELKNIGSLMIELARGIAEDINESVACRFITVDADTHNNPTVNEFYAKNSFVPNDSYKVGRTLSMRLNIYDDGDSIEEYIEDIS